jgi:uncharacterized membrane protein
MQILAGINSNSKITLLFFLGLVFGVIYIFLIPPFQAPDEVHHFFRSYHVSKGYLFGEKTQDQRFGGYLPESLYDISTTFRPLRYNTEQRTHKDTISAAAKMPLKPENEIFLDFPNVAYYAPFGYLPQATAVGAGRLFRAPPLYLFYLGRLANFLFWWAVLFLAVRLMPFHQSTFAYLAILPASLFFHTGINPDAATHALAFLLIASLLRLAYVEGPLKKKHLLLILVSLIITVNKVVYAPLFLLGWLIPVQKFGRKRNYFLFNSGVLLLHAVVILLWYRVANDLFIPYDEYNPLFREDKQLNPGVDPHAQLRFIVENPLEFAGIVYASYDETLPWTLKHYAGKFGWEGNYLPKWLTDALLWGILFFAVTESTAKAYLRWRSRLFLIGTGLLMAMAFTVVIYMQWNTPGKDFITGLSGRYFIPIFPLFILALNNDRFSIPPWLHFALMFLLLLTANGFGACEAMGRYY